MNTQNQNIKTTLETVCLASFNHLGRESSRGKVMNISVIRVIGACFVLGLLLNSPPAIAQLGDVNTDNVLNAPYRGPVTAWREACMDMGYGEVKNFVIYYEDPGHDDPDYPIAKLTFPSGWDRDVVRIYQGHNASGPEIVPNGEPLEATVSISEGSSLANWRWNLSIKAIGTRSQKKVDFPIEFSYEAGTHTGPASDDVCICGSTITSFCCGDCNNILGPPTYCDYECCCDSSCHEKVEVTKTGILDISVAPTSMVDGVSGVHPWHSSSVVLDVVSGAAQLVATVNESTHMIGRSFLHVIDSGDENVEILSYDVRLPGMPETVFIQDRETFNLGTPWPGHIPGYWVEDRGEGLGYDVVGPDGTIYRFSEPAPVDATEETDDAVLSESDPEGLWYLKKIIPQGCENCTEAVVSYTYFLTPNSTSESGCSTGNADGPCRKYLSTISDGDGNSIHLNRESTGCVSSVAVKENGTQKAIWTIGSNAGWISSVVQPDGKGNRYYGHDTNSGRLEWIDNDDNQGTGTMYSFTYDVYDANILTESSAGQAKYTYYNDTYNGRQTIIRGGNNTTNQVISCSYIGQTSGDFSHLLSSVSQTGGYDDRVEYTWDETNEWGNVVLLEEILPNNTKLKHYYASTGGGESGRGLCGTNARGDWILRLYMHQRMSCQHGVGTVNSWNLNFVDALGEIHVLDAQIDNSMIPDGGTKTMPTIWESIITIDEDFMIEDVSVGVDLQLLTVCSGYLTCELEHIREYGATQRVALFDRIGTGRYHTLCVGENHPTYDEHGAQLDMDATFLSSLHLGHLYVSTRDAVWADLHRDVHGEWYPTLSPCDNGYIELCTEGEQEEEGEDTPFRRKTVLVASSGSGELSIFDVNYAIFGEAGLLRMPRVVKSYDGMGNETVIKYRDDGGLDLGLIETITGPQVTQGIPGGQNQQAETIFTYNSANLLSQKKVKATDGASATWNVTEYEYDSLGRLLRVIVDPGEGNENLVTEYATTADPLRYDGQPDFVKDPYGFYTGYTYDDAGRVTNVKRFLATNDTQSNKAQIIDYAYDDNGWLETETLTLNAFDESGTPVAHQAGSSDSQVTTYTRDRLGQVINISVGDGTSTIVQTAYGYTNIGELAYTIGQDGIYSETRWNDRGLVESERVGYGADVAHGDISTGTEYTGQRVSYTYDESGRVATVTTNEEATDAKEKRVVNYNDGSGARDKFGRVKKITESPGKLSTLLTYDGNSNIIRITDFQKNVSYKDVFTCYDEAQRPWQVTNAARNGGETQIELTTYRADNRIAETIVRGSDIFNGSLIPPPEPGDRTTGNVITVYSYDGVGRVTDLTSINAFFNTSEVYEDRSKSYSYGVSQDNRGTTVTETMGIRSTVSTYDALGRLVKQTSSEGGTSGPRTEVVYNSLSLPVDTVVYNGNSTTVQKYTSYGYDAAGRIRQTYDVSTESLPKDIGQSPTTTYHYYGDSDCTQPECPSGNEGRLWKITNPIGKAITYKYNDSNHTKTVTDPFGNEIKSTFDGLGRLIQLKTTLGDGSGQPSSTDYNYNFGYTDASNMEKTVQRLADGPLSTANFDPLGRITDYTNRKQSKTTFTYDNTSSVCKVVEDVGGLSRTSTCRTGPKGIPVSQTFYNTGGQEQVTDYRIAPDGTITGIRYPNPDGSSSYTEEFKFNVYGELAAKKDIANRNTAYAHSITAEGRQVVITTQTSGTYTYAYNALGQITEASVAGPESSSSVILEYDDYGRLKTETQTYSEADSPAETRYAYNDAGQLTSITYPGGEILNLNAGTGLDDLGRPTTVSFGVAGSEVTFMKPAYFGSTIESIKVFSPNGTAFMQLERTFDDEGRQKNRKWSRIDQAENPTGEVFDEFELYYDVTDNITAVYSDQLFSSTVYELDALNRMLKASKGDPNIDENQTLGDATGLAAGSIVMEYDRTPDANGENGLDLQGNVTHSTLTLAQPDGTTSTNTFTADVNIANMFDDVVFMKNGWEEGFEPVYDPFGNMIYDGWCYLKYNDLNQLIEVHEVGTAIIASTGPDDITLLGDKLVSMTYDGLGRQISRKEYDSNGDVILHLRNLYAGQRVLEITKVIGGQDDVLVKRNLWSPEGLDVILRADEDPDAEGADPLKSFYFTTDHMGSPTAAIVATDPPPGLRSGEVEVKVVERYAYDAHGQIYEKTAAKCRRADIDCDGIVGATDLVLVLNAYTTDPTAAEGARENICGGGTDGLTPDSAIDELDLVCVRNELGKGLPGLYDTSTTATPDPYEPDAGEKPTYILGLHGLPVDKTTGLVYARARHYHPKLGCWMSRDPKGYIDGGNLYEAFESNPARFSDPMGTGIITWMLAGEYGISDVDFMRQGGLQGTAWGFLKGGGEGIAYGAVEVGKTVSPFHLSDQQKRINRYIGAEYELGGADAGDEYWVLAKAYRLWAADSTGVTALDSFVRGDTVTFHEDGHIETRKFDSWTDRVQTGLMGLSQLTGFVGGTGYLAQPAASVGYASLRSGRSFGQSMQLAYRFRKQYLSAGFREVLIQSKHASATRGVYSRVNVNVTRSHYPNPRPRPGGLLKGDNLAGPGAVDDIMVIGRQSDTAAYIGRKGHRVLDTNIWDLNVNDGWMMRGIMEKRTFKLASEVNWGSLRRLQRKPNIIVRDLTVFHHELKMLRDAGYVRRGNLMLPGMP